MTMLEVPTAIHRGEDDLPWVDLGDGSLLKVLQIKEREGLWVIRNRFMPGYQVQTHKHTGPVYAFTTTGAWKYKESDFVNRAGSFLYEPAGSVHTLMVPDDNTEPTDVFFAIWGANLNLDANGNVEMVIDASLILQAYYGMCEAQDFRSPTWCSTDMAAPIDIVREFCAACEAGDIDAILEFFTDDAVYHNIPVAPVQGKDAIRATFDMFMTGVEEVEFRVLNIAAAGNVVLTERVDVFVLPSGTIDLPVMGTFELVDGKIAAWRDYFDLNQYMQQLPQ